MSVDLEVAIARRAALAEEIEKLDKLIELLGWWRDSSGAGRSDSPPVLDSSSSVDFSSPIGTEGVQKSHASPAEVVKESLAVLIAAERPMKRGDLLSALTRRNVKVGGGDKVRFLGRYFGAPKTSSSACPGGAIGLRIDLIFRPFTIPPKRLSPTTTPSLICLANELISKGRAISQFSSSSGKPRERRRPGDPAARGSATLSRACGLSRFAFGAAGSPGLRCAAPEDDGRKGSGRG